MLRQLVRKGIDQPVIQMQDAIGYRKPDSGDGEALCVGVDVARCIWRIVHFPEDAVLVAHADRLQRQILITCIVMKVLQFCFQ